VELLRRLFGGYAGRTAPFAGPALQAGNHVVQVVGESNYQAALEQACDGSNDAGPNRPSVIAHLVPEPDNRYDSNAVSVHVNGMKVGHLGREDALAYQGRLLELRSAGVALTCSARIKGGYAVQGLSRASFGIELFLAPPAEL
jgi:hypothetical protein